MNEEISLDGGFSECAEDIITPHTERSKSLRNYNIFKTCAIAEVAKLLLTKLEKQE